MNEQLREIEHHRFTRHSLRRMQQRCIPEAIIGLLWDFGESQSAGKGAVSYSFTKRSWRVARAYLGAQGKHFEQYRNAYCLPETVYSTATGYGWVEREFLRRRDVWLDLRPNPSGNVGLYLHAQQDSSFSTDQLIPCAGQEDVCLHRLIHDEDGRFIVHNRYQTDDSFYCHEAINEDVGIRLTGVGPLFWPSWISDVRSDVEPESLFGLVENP